MDRIDPVFVHFFNDKANGIFRDFFAFFWNVFENTYHMPGNRIIVVRFDMASESFIDIVKAGRTVNKVFIRIQFLNRVDFVFIVFITDFSDDFFQKIFQGDNSGGSAVFIQNNGYIDRIFPASGLINPMFSDIHK